MKGLLRRGGLTFAIFVAATGSGLANPPVIANFGPQQIYVGQHKTYRMHVRAYGRALSYHWWHQEPDASQGHAIPYGEGFAPDRPTLAVPDAAPNRDYNGSYWCVITNQRTGETTTSPRAVVTVVAVPRIRRHPSSQTVPAGGSATFTVQADPGAPVAMKFQWYRDGHPIPNARRDTLTLNHVSPSKSGSYYSCKVTTIGGSTQSGGGLLTVTSQ
jgi:hypothetical protein